MVNIRSLSLHSVEIHFLFLYMQLERSKCLFGVHDSQTLGSACRTLRTKFHNLSHLPNVHMKAVENMLKSGILLKDCFELARLRRPPANGWTTKGNSRQAAYHWIHFMNFAPPSRLHLCFALKHDEIFMHDLSRTCHIYIYISKT